MGSAIKMFLDQFHAVLVSQASFLGETSGIAVKCPLFSQATSHYFLCVFLSYI